MVTSAFRLDGKAWKLGLTCQGLQLVHNSGRRAQASNTKGDGQMRVGGFEGAQAPHLSHRAERHIL